MNRKCKIAYDSNMVHGYEGQWITKIFLRVEEPLTNLIFHFFVPDSWQIFSFLGCYIIRRLDLYCGHGRGVILFYWVPMVCSISNDTNMCFLAFSHMHLRLCSIFYVLKYSAECSIKILNSSILNKLDER